MKYPPYLLFPLFGAVSLRSLPLSRTVPVMTQASREEASKKLRNFILATQTSQLNEFNACLTMLGNWSKYILNAFGYRNFENFRNRIFLSLTK